MTSERQTELFNNMITHISELVSPSDIEDTFSCIGFTKKEMAECEISPYEDYDPIEDYRANVRKPYIENFLSRVGKKSIDEVTIQELEDESVLIMKKVAQGNYSTDFSIYAEFIDTEIAVRNPLD